MRQARLIDQRIASIRSAMPPIRPSSNRRPCLVKPWFANFRPIRDFDQAIAELAPTHDDYRLFRTLPGAGPVLAPRLLVAFGEQPAEDQQYNLESSRHRRALNSTVRSGNSLSGEVA